jgi:hypothetical protein
LYQYEGVQRDRDQTESGWMRCPEGRMKQRCASPVAGGEAGEAGIGGVLPR